MAVNEANQTTGVPSRKTATPDKHWPQCLVLVGS